MDETLNLLALEINQLTALGIEVLLGKAPGFTSRKSARSALLLSGEPIADLNVLLMSPEPDAENFFKESIAVARYSKLPLIALLLPDCAARLERVALELKLTPLGKMPMMICDAPAPLKAPFACRIEQVRDERSGTIAGDIQADGFGLPRESVARTFDKSRGQNSADTFIGFWNDEPACALTMVRTDSMAGVWAMATAVKFQRQGIGRMILNHVLERYRQADVYRFYLNSSQAGFRLYASCGFRTIAEHSLWLLNA